MSEEAPKESTEKERVLVSLSATHKNKLALLAQAKQVSMSELLRAAIEQWTLEHYIDEFAFWSADLT